MNLEIAIQQIKKKEEKGLSFLYDHYSAALLGIIVRIVKSEKLGEEILQQTFLKIWQNIDSFNPSKSTFFTWMAVIARNSAIDQVRLKNYKYNSKTEPFDLSIHNNPTIDTHAKIDVQNLVVNLDEKYKVVLDYIYLKGHSHQEAAKLLDLPLGTVKSRLKKAIQILRNTLKDEKVVFMSYSLIIILMILLWS